MQQYRPRWDKAFVAGLNSFVGYCLLCTIILSNIMIPQVLPAILM